MGIKLKNKTFYYQISKDNSKQKYVIGLCGNPNVGKSSIFNTLTKNHQHTGNWIGKTVGNAKGSCTYKDKEFLFVDIPGTYSLMSNSKEEEIARDFICFEKKDLMIVVVDATNLERNLNLVYQTMEMTNNVLVCVNLIDEAEKKGIDINLKLLSSKLGVPVVGVSAKEQIGIEDLLEEIYKIFDTKKTISPNYIKYDKYIEDKVEEIKNESLITENEYFRRWVCLKLIEGNQRIVQTIKSKIDFNKNSENINYKIKNLRERIKEKMQCNITEYMGYAILRKCEETFNEVVHYNIDDYNKKDRKIDKILSSKILGIPIMLSFLCMIFWITIVGANYPSEMLSILFSFIGEKISLLFSYLKVPDFISGMLLDGMYNTLTWVISVMLPPMLIFFPLFTILEEMGFLPRIAFNLDRCFKCAKVSGKQALTMCMGFGCNAAAVMGCRIIGNKRERLIAILTNVFMPCNGRFPILITISSIFIGVAGGIKGSLISTLCVMLVVIIGIVLTFIVSRILSVTILKGESLSFIMELPPYRKPNICQTILRSITDRILNILLRSFLFIAPAGIVIWLLANIDIGSMSILNYIACFLDPFAKLMGLDGYILTAFIIGIPANEIVLPVILMCYLGSSSMVNIENMFQIKEILLQNGWNILTAINVMLFTLLHFPCITTLLSIKSETGSIRWVILSVLIPSLCGVIICMITNFIFLLI